MNKQTKNSIKCKCGKRFKYADKDELLTWLGGYVWVRCPHCNEAHIIN